MKMIRSGGKGRSRRAVSEIISVMMLVIIVVATVGIVLLFGTGVIQSLIAGGVSTPLAGSGQMTVSGSTGHFGVLTLTLRNTQSVSVAGVIVTCPPSFAACVGPMGAAAPGSTLVQSAGVTSAAGSSFVSGMVYSILMQVTFKTGSIITLDVSVTAVS